VKMPNTFKSKEYADTCFMYAFCSGNRRAVVEYMQRSTSQNSTPQLFWVVHRTLSDTVSFRRADAKFTRITQEVLQHFPYFGQNQHEISAIFFSVVNFECRACYCSAAE
jgi:hypothetical protein